MLYIAVGFCKVVAHFNVGLAEDFVENSDMADIYWIKKNFTNFAFGIFLKWGVKPNYIPCSMLMPILVFHQYLCILDKFLFIFSCVSTYLVLYFVARIYISIIY